jgi:hypothetical protein
MFIQTNGEMTLKKSQTELKGLQANIEISSNFPFLKLLQIQLKDIFDFYFLENFFLTSRQIFSFRHLCVKLTTKESKGFSLSLNIMQ